MCVCVCVCVYIYADVYTGSTARYLTFICVLCTYAHVTAKRIGFANLSRRYALYTRIINIRCMQLDEKHRSHRSETLPSRRTLRDFTGKE